MLKQCKKERKKKTDQKTVLLLLWILNNNVNQTIYNLKRMKVMIEAPELQ